MRKIFILLISVLFTNISFSQKVNIIASNYFTIKIPDNYNRDVKRSNYRRECFTNENGSSIIVGNFNLGDSLNMKYNSDFVKDNINPELLTKMKNMNIRNLVTKDTIIQKINFVLSVYDFDYEGNKILAIKNISFSFKLRDQILNVDFASGLKFYDVEKLIFENCIRSIIIKE